MQTACPTCPPCSAAQGGPVRTTRRDGYLETRHAELALPGPARPGWCVSCCGAAVSPATPATPPTTTTTVTPCTPPPGAVPQVAADGDRVFLDFQRASSARPRSGCGRGGPCEPCCACVPRWPCGACVPEAPKAARVASLREVEGRCCAVLVIVTFMGMVVGLALFSDPLLLELSTRLQRARCVTVNYTIVMGASNCTWASCRESCTSQAYKCPQIFVNYTLFPEANAEDYDEGEYNVSVPTSSPRPPAPAVETVPLLVNVAACGLDAVKYSCTKFYNDYMGPGLEFECEVADAAVATWWRVAVPVAVREATSTGLSAWMGGLLPLALCVACVLYIRARRLFTVEPVVAAAARGKRASLRHRGAISSAPRSFYKRKMLEMDEWRQRRRQLVLTGAGRGSQASRVHGEGDSDELMSSEEQDDEDDLDDVVVGASCMEHANDDVDDDVATEACLPPPPWPSLVPPTPPCSPCLAPPPWPRPVPPPPPCSPETSPPPTPDLVPLIVLEYPSPRSPRSPRGLRAIPEEPLLAPRALRRGSASTSSTPAGSPAWRGVAAQGNIQTVSATVHAHQNYDISQ